VGGDRKSHWKLLVDSMPGLRAEVRRLVADRDAADAILREVSLTILTRDAPVEPDRFRAWSLGIARRVVARASRPSRPSRASRAPR
jgi:DNA-directed RNA polymerase specialized sigma24 family protein